MESGMCRRLYPSGGRDSLISRYVDMDWIGEGWGVVDLQVLGQSIP